MRRGAEAEIQAMSRKTKQIVVDHTERVCINCQHYEPRLRENRGNIAVNYITSDGYCLQWERHAGPLDPACDTFMKEEWK